MKKKLYLIAIFVITLIGITIANFTDYAPFASLVAIVLAVIDAIAVAIYFSN